MSTYTIVKNTDKKLAKQITSYLADKGKDLLLFEKFKVGKETTVEDMRRVLRLSRIFCQNKCSIDKEHRVLIKEKINKILIYSNEEM